MKNLTGMPKNLGLALELNKSLQISNSVSKLFKSQQWYEQSNVLKLNSAIIKGLSQKNAVNFNNLSVQSKFEIPPSTIETLTSITKNHKNLFASTREIAKLFKDNSRVFSQLNNLQYALGAISTQMAKFAASQEKWGLLDDFEEITNEAASINEQIIDEQGISIENLENIENFLQKIEIKVDNIGTDSNAIFWKLIAVISFFLAVIGESRNWTKKPDFATKHEVEKIITTQFLKFETKLKEQDDFRTTNHVCKVLLKPKKKTTVLTKLPTQFDVIVIQIHHKWVYVSYINPKDKLPQTGWIKKKYLSKP